MTGRIVVASGLVAATLIGWAGGAWASGPSAVAERAHEPVDRVLVLSLPYISWDDIEDADIPHLRGLLKGSALANLTTRTIGRSDLSSGYVTLGAGTRATGSGTPSDGAALAVDELFGDVPAGDVFAARTGRHVNGGIVHLGVAPIDVANEAEPVNVPVGSLGETLAGVDRSAVVIANGDWFSPDLDALVYRRDAVAALMGPRGILPAGVVLDGLLEQRGSWPFGVRTDLDAYEAAFEQGWRSGAVVLVEASDLVRANEIASVATPEQGDHLYRRALERFDELVGVMLEDVDARRDAVIVMSPTPSTGQGQLTIAALRAPGRPPGLLRSPSTRRSGYVLLADVAPTIVDLVGLSRVKDMKGRPAVIDANDQDLVERVRSLADGSDAAVFRDRVREGVTIAFVVVQGLLAAAAAIAIARGSRARQRAWIRLAALWVLGFVPAVYLARLLPLHQAGIVPYAMFLAALTIGTGFAYRFLGRRNEVDPLIAAVAVICALFVIDVIGGAHLELSSSFGYSPTIGVRVAGFGNITYSFLSISALVLAGMIVHRVRGSSGRRIALSILAIVFIADVAPFLGSDVGGALSLVPAFGIATILLLGIQIQHPIRTALFGFAAAILATSAVAVWDLSRPLDQRTHLGRLVEDIGNNGITEFTDTISRKLDQNLSTLTNSSWRFLLPVCLAFLAFAWFGRAQVLRRLVERIPQVGAVLVGAGVAAVLGYALNDSGVTVPAAMMAILTPSVIYLLLAEEHSSDPDSDGREVVDRPRSVSRVRR